jgi:FKBP-type peptidyl-prolyl cis-trans isomerase FkpA
MTVTLPWCARLLGAVALTTHLGGCFENGAGLNPSEHALRKLARHMAPITAQQAAAVAACTRAELALLDTSEISEQVLRAYYKEINAADLPPAQSVDEISVIATPMGAKGVPPRLGEYSLTQLMGLGQTHIITTTIMWGCIADRVPVKQFSPGAAPDAGNSHTAAAQSPEAARGAREAEAAPRIRPEDEGDLPPPEAAGQTEPLSSGEGAAPEVLQATPSTEIQEAPGAGRKPVSRLVIIPKGPGRSAQTPLPSKDRHTVTDATDSTGSQEENEKQDLFQTTASGLRYRRIGAEASARPAPLAADAVCVRLSGWTAGGVPLQGRSQASEQTETRISLLVPGLAEGLQLMREGERFLFVIPSDLAYGERGHPDGHVGPNMSLTVEAHLIRVGKCGAPA